MKGLKCVHGKDVFNGAICIGCEKLNREFPDSEAEEIEDAAGFVEFARKHRTTDKEPIIMTTEQHKVYLEKLAKTTRKRETNE